MARFQLFGPLMRVPSLVLNKLQDAALRPQRANGPLNTMKKPGLDVDATSWDQRTIAASFEKQRLFVTTLDDTIDWRDRYLSITWRFDPDRDIRPGGPDEQAFAFEEGSTQVYTGAGNTFWILSPSMSLAVLMAGPLVLQKASGFLFLEISSGLQLKERT